MPKKTFLNIRNDNADSVEDDYTVTMEGNKASSLNSKKATKLIKGESPDKIKKAKFTCQLSSNGCPICLASLRNDPEANLHPHLIMPGRKRIKIILAHTT